MALADVHTSSFPSALDLGPGDRTLDEPPCHCAVAIDALERASTAIACADIEARCKAVATATEAMTTLFLEFDGTSQDLSTQSAGRLYESILGRLLGVNLHNNPKMAHEAIAMIERQCNACARWSSTGSPPTKVAVHRAKP